MKKSQPKFNKGEWCYCDFRLQQVTETSGARITETFDGIVRSGGYDKSTECYPITVDIKLVSEFIEDLNNKLRGIGNRLNWPEISKALIERWVLLCESIGDAEELKSQYNSVTNFCKVIIEKHTELKNTYVEGVRIF